MSPSSLLLFAPFVIGLAGFLRKISGGRVVDGPARVLALLFLLSIVVVTISGPARPPHELAGSAAFLAGSAFGIVFVVERAGAKGFRPDVDSFTAAVKALHEARERQLHLTTSLNFESLGPRDGQAEPADGPPTERQGAPRGGFTPRTAPSRVDRARFDKEPVVPLADAFAREVLEAGGPPRRTVIVFDEGTDANLAMADLADAFGDRLTLDPPNHLRLRSVISTKPTVLFVRKGGMLANDERIDLVLAEPGVISTDWWNEQIAPHLAQGFHLRAICVSTAREA